MKCCWLGWCLVMAVLTFVPVGLRVLTWQKGQTPALDPEMVQAGEVLFKHEWKAHDPLCPEGDGLGPVFNASSCVACHHQGGVGGSGGLERNVTTFVVQPGNTAQARREGVIHTSAISSRFLETFSLLHPSLPPVSPVRTTAAQDPRRRISGIPLAGMPREVRLSERRTPALFGLGLIDAIPDRLILANERKHRLGHARVEAGESNTPAGRALRLADGRVGKFGWKAQTATLADFVQAACANELGLGNPGQAQPTPLGVPSYRAVGLDLTLEQCNQITAFVASLPRPVEKLPTNPDLRGRAVSGKALFKKVGCAECHQPDLGSVSGIYSDLLLHRMGADLTGEGTTYYGPPPSPDIISKSGSKSDEWRTPPLWGVADSGPYLHDGRARTVEEAIRLHAGEAGSARQRFEQLGPDEQAQVVAFLGTLRAP